MTRLRLLFATLLAVIAVTSLPIPEPVLQAVMPAVSPAAGEVLTAADAAGPAALELMRSVREAYLDGAVVVIDGEARPATAVGVPEASELSLSVTGCTYTADEVESVLQTYKSPAAGTGLGEHTVKECKRTKVDNAYWLWMFVMESTAGTAPGWYAAGANTGNIRCFGYTPCHGGFRDYQGDWKKGTTAHFDLLVEYRDTEKYGNPPRRHTTITDALNTWAPPIENNTESYAHFVATQVREARSIKQGEFVAEGDEGPVEDQPAAAAPSGSYTAPALALTGCLGTNVRAAHSASPALHDVTIPPGGDWSFNENWVITDQLVVCGVLGGGVCNQASRYSNVARNLGLSVTSVYHGYIFDGAVPQEDNIAIWSSGKRGGQDLVIHNTTDKTVRIVAAIEGDQLVVRGWTVS